MPERLGRADWVKAAASVLVSHGVEALGVDRLAKSLSVTKGSFYWHFKNRDALLDAVLKDWQERLTLSIIKHLDASGGTPEQRLLVLLQGERTRRDGGIELAIRLWARTDVRASKAIQETDDLRLSYLADLFEAAGNRPDAARAKAVLAYGYMRVTGSPSHRREAGELELAKDILLSEPQS